jgi:1,2-diacylglycerol 3-beta-galactosyltransferase
LLMMEPPLRILLLFSDTGGGHRSAAEALIEAWNADHPGEVDVDMVDVFRAYTPFPFNQTPRTYPFTVRYLRPLYAATFYGSDGPRRAGALACASYPYVRRGLRNLLREHPADMVVSVHPLFNHCVNWAMRGLDVKLPYVTVVTDLCSGHASWYYRHVTRLIVPTPDARDRALRFGVPSGRIVVHGMPVAQKFAKNPYTPEDRPAIRRRLGLPSQGRLILIVGGGEGMGPVERFARAIDAALPTAEPADQLVVIAGRNQILRGRLQNQSWRRPFRAEGFVANMPEWLAAADVLVTKAGPGSITEGLLSGLPLLLMGKVPGQEDGNVGYVTSQGVGVWQPDPDLAATQLRDWIASGNPALAEMSVRARQLAVPDAANAIAEDILQIGRDHIRSAGRTAAGIATLVTAGSV